MFTSDTLLDIYHQATSGIFAMLIGVVGLSLVVGGIVIMNIMLMVVSERTREIGLRKSLGARRRDILWQILTESITLSTFGGIVGTALGFLVARVISKVSPLPAIVEPWSVVLGIGMTAVVGLFFGALSGHARGARSIRSKPCGANKHALEPVRRNRSRCRGNASAATRCGRRSPCSASSSASRRSSA